MRGQAVGAALIRPSGAPSPASGRRGAISGCESSLFNWLRRHFRAAWSPEPVSFACSEVPPPNGASPIRRNASRRPKSRGADAKRIWRQRRSHANSLQGPPIAVLSVFNELAQATRLFCAPGKSGRGPAPTFPGRTARPPPGGRRRAARGGGRRRERHGARSLGAFPKENKHSTKTRLSSTIFTPPQEA